MRYHNCKFSNQSLHKFLHGYVCNAVFDKVADCEGRSFSSQAQVPYCKMAQLVYDLIYVTIATCLVSRRRLVIALELYTTNVVFVMR